MLHLKVYTSNHCHQLLNLVNLLYTYSLINIRLTKLIKENNTSLK